MSSTKRASTKRASTNRASTTSRTSSKRKHQGRDQDAEAAELLVAWCGIDVSKDVLDVHLLKPNNRQARRSVDNNAPGWQKLLSWVAHQLPGISTSAGQVHFCLEATGAYSEGVALYLAEAGLLLSVVNPYYIKHYAQALGLGNKTDPVDAAAIADYCRTQQPAPWRMCAPEVRLLSALMRRHTAMQAQLQQERNRLSVPGLFPEIAASLKRSIRFLEKQLANLEEQVQRHVQQHPTLKADEELLRSIPGIGPTLAVWILAELPDVQQFADAPAAAAYAGLNPREWRSGKSVHRRSRMSKRGNGHLRRALYMPAAAAIRFNPVCKSLYERLVGRGLAPKAALGAVMRKLLMLAYGVLKGRQPFDQAHASHRADQQGVQTHKAAAIGDLASPAALAQGA